MTSNLLPIAKEGWNYIGYTLIAFIVFTILDLEVLSIAVLLLGAFFIFSFRNPERELPAFELNSVLSPVDGNIIAIDEIDNSEYRYKIAIESTYADVAILRSPMNCKVKSCAKKHGSKLNLDTPLAKKLNENISIVFEDENKNTLKILHLVKQSFCGIKLDNMQKKSLIQSARYGVMVSGISYVYVPQNFRLNIKLGDKLEASKTFVGYFS